EPGQYLECLLWKARATAVLAKPELRAGSADAAAAASPAAETAEAYFAETGLGAVPRYDGRALVAGTRIAGPAIVRQPTTTGAASGGAPALVAPLGNRVRGGAGGGGGARRRARGGALAR